MAMNDLSHLLLPDMGDKEDPTVMEETKVSDGEESENGEYLSDNGQQAQGGDPQQNQAKKRGRPKNTDVIDKLKREISQLTARCQSLQQDVCDLNSKNTDLKELNESTFKELDELKTLYCESESEKIELMEQLTNDEEIKVEKPQGLFVYDQITKNLCQQLPKSVEWVDKLCVNLSDMDPREIVQRSETLDIVLFSVGACEIRQGSKGLEVFGKFNRIVTELIKVTSVVATNLPPTVKKGNASQVSLFNFKLAKVQSGYQLINSDFNRMSLDENDNVTDKALRSLAEQIDKEIKLPTAIKSRASPTDEGYETQVVLEIQQKDIGKVIGKSGFTIAKLTNDHKVQMSIGKWCEPKKERRDELAEIMDAVLIKGNSQKVQEAIKSIQTIVNEPATKRFKTQ